MDPITAFSLACGVVQLVDFGCKLAKQTKEIVEHGHIDRYKNLEDQVSNLSKWREKVQDTLSCGPSTCNGHSELADLATKCNSTADELLKELESLKLHESPGRLRSFKAFKMAILALWKHETIERLKKTFESYRAALDSGVLLDIQKTLASLRIPNNSSDTSQAIADGFRNCDASFEEFAKILSDQHNITRRFIEQRFLREEEKKREDQFMDSLRFPDIFCRQERVKNAHRKTFRWIFKESMSNPLNEEDSDLDSSIESESDSVPSDSDGSDTDNTSHTSSDTDDVNSDGDDSDTDGTQSDPSEIFDSDNEGPHHITPDVERQESDEAMSSDRRRSWPSFTQWLRSGSKAYWINGKAGSGKSTLMNFILSSSRTKKCLKQWSGECELLKPAFFFWAAGSPLQKSTEGFLRSIIFQILSDQPKFIALIQKHNDVFGRSASALTWTEKRLRDSLQVLCTEASKSCRICIFIDGLDEFEGYSLDLLHLVKIISGHNNVKCCLSSRPEKPLVDAFAKTPCLRLQDLTANDMKRFVHAKMTDLPQILNYSVTERRKILNVILRKANGVFLWVELAVKSQIIGIRNEDSFATLLSRLEALPDEIQNMYSRMISRIDKVYYEEAASYLLMTMMSLDEDEGRSWRSRNLIRPGDLATIQCMAIIRHGLDRRSLRVRRPVMSPEEFERKCQQTRKRITSTCAGFLEVTREARQNWRDLDFLEETWKVDWGAVVEFSHRSAKDFFMTPQGANFLQHSDLTQDKWLVFAASYVVRTAIRQSPVEAGYVIMAAALFDPQTSDDELSFVELMNYFLGAIETVRLSVESTHQELDWYQSMVFKGALKLFFSTGFHFDGRGRSLPFYTTQNRVMSVTSPLPQNSLEVNAIFQNLVYVKHQVESISDPNQATRLAQMMALEADVGRAQRTDRHFVHGCTALSACGVDWNASIRPGQTVWQTFLLDLLNDLIDRGPRRPPNNDEKADLLRTCCVAGADSLAKIELEWDGRTKARKSWSEAMSFGRPWPIIRTIFNVHLFPPLVPASKRTAFIDSMRAINGENFALSPSLEVFFDIRKTENLHDVLWTTSFTASEDQMASFVEQMGLIFDDQAGGERRQTAAHGLYCWLMEQLMDGGMLRDALFDGKQILRDKIKFHCRGRDRGYPATR